MQLVSAGDEKPAAPYQNPLAAKANYHMTHAMADFSPLSGPTGPGRRLNADEIQWQGTGPVSTWAPLYSTPYPNGKRVIWVGGYDRIAKLDADTLDVLTTYTIGGNTYFGDDEIEHHIALIDQLDDKAMAEHSVKVWTKPYQHVMSFYRWLSRDNEYFIPHIATDGSISLRVYGEMDATNPASEVELRREWKLPEELAGNASIVGTNMTSDGWVIMAALDGTVIALSRDFKEYHLLKLPSKKIESSEQVENKDYFASFMRNGLHIDDQNGIYIVTRDYMHRVQWMGDRFSLDEKDGAWAASYPNELGAGSGTTPGLMGWGPDEDHLVVVADGSYSNNLIAFWRDEIPADWKAIPGFDRRVAGITPVKFGVSGEVVARVENAPVIYGYGVFVGNTRPKNPLPDQGSRFRQWLAESFYMHVPGHEAGGGSVIMWDPEARELKTVWGTETNLVSAMCTISGATEILYCWGSRDREWTLEGIDWATGEHAFHYTLGKTHRYNPLGGPIILSPNNTIDCGCSGGMGIVRVSIK